jgi:hypothetical protein
MEDEVPKSFWRSISYIDTVEILLLKRMDREDFDRFWASRFGEQAQYDSRYRFELVPTRGVFYIAKIVLHQPAGAELVALAEVEAKGECKVTRVHVALDLLTLDEHSPDDLRRHIEARLLPSRRARYFVQSRDKTRKPSVSRVESTTYYFRGVSAGTEIALYSDKYSKTGYGWKCCHLEYRVIGVRALTAVTLSTLGDVYVLDHRAFWSTQLEFWRPPTEDAVARSGNGAARSRTAASLGTMENRKDVRTLFRLATHDRTRILNAYLLFLRLHENAKRYHPRPIRMFQKVDHDWALPPARNNMWPARIRIRKGA